MEANTKESRFFFLSRTKLLYSMLDKLTRGFRAWKHAGTEDEDKHEKKTESADHRRALIYESFRERVPCIVDR